MRHNFGDHSQKYKLFCKFAIVLSFLILNSGRAGGQEFFLKHFTVDDGLPSNDVYQVMQDSLGHLLIATDRGCARYDGNSFELLQSPRGRSNPIFYMYRSSACKIFLSGIKGLLYEYDVKGIKAYPFNSKLSSIYQHAGLLIANSISESKDSLWISYNNDYNYYYDVGSCVVAPGGNIKKLNEPDGIYFDLQTNFYYRQLSGTEYQKSTQPLIIKWKNGQVHRDSVQVSWRAGYIRRLYHEKIGEKDVFAVGRRLIVFVKQEKVADYLMTHQILSMSLINVNKLALGLEGGGVNIYSLTNFKFDTPETSLLNQYSVTSVFSDNQGGEWFSTEGNGIFYMYPSKTRVWNDESKIVSIAKNHDYAYVAYSNNKVKVYQKTKLVSTFTIPVEQDDRLKGLAFDRHDNLLAFAINGVFRRQAQQWSFLRGYIKALASSSNSDLLFAADAKYPEVHIYKSFNGDMVDNIRLPKRANAMWVDPQNQLWVGTMEGLYRCQPGSPIGRQVQATFPGERIVAIDTLTDGSLVVASLSNGVILMKGGQAWRLDASTGFSASINSMVCDSNQVWLGTNKGLTKAAVKDGKLIAEHFGLESGLPTLDIHEFSVVNGWLYLSWMNNLSMVQVSALQNKMLPNRTFISSVSVNGIPYVNNEKIFFRYNQNNVEFNFNCVDLIGAKQQQYAYILQGFDEDWRITINRNVKYTNLPPGNFRFKVRPLNEHYDPSLYGSFEFTIQTAFWQTHWFLAAVVLSSLLMIALVFRVRIRMIRQKSRLTLAVSESQQKSLVQLINPHFTYNVLNTIQGAILTQNKIEAASTISRFGKLMRMSMEMSRKKWVPLSKEIELLNSYLELEITRSPGRFQYEINVLDSVPKPIGIPTMLVQPFVENAVKHGVGHLEGTHGKISVVFSFKDHQLFCKITDNGIGRHASTLINEAHYEDHQSSGIEITVSRLQLLHEQYRSVFYYSMEDVEPTGTEVLISLPFTFKHESDTFIDN
jgi:hypothetical protein